MRLISTGAIMSTYFMYCRKSSEAEDGQILSIDSQLTERKQYAAKQRLAISFGIHGGKIAQAPGVRPVFNTMMARLCQGDADGILCWKLDRLARNPVHGGSII
jgi:DNA invertase Pin-like site-specific DNA recombinase